MLLRLTLCAALPFLAAACGDANASMASGGDASEPMAAAPAAASEPAPVAAAAAQPARASGSITGTITFEGKVPELPRIDLSPDPKCKEMHGDEGMPVTSGIRTDAAGGLADVFVQLTSGVPDAKYEVPEEPVVLDQRGCTYEPHVFGVMKRQTIKILNSDPTMHNIHAMPKSNKEFNLGMPDQGSSREQEFKKAEQAIPIKCDVHPWMLCYSFVMEHPYFGVTTEAGAFSILGGELPDGEYGIKLWHETLGEHEGKVKVAGGTGSFDFVWKKD